MKLNFMTDQGSSRITASWARRAGNAPFCACLAAWALETLAAFGASGAFGIFENFFAFPGLVMIPNAEVTGAAATCAAGIWAGYGGIRAPPGAASLAGGDGLPPSAGRPAFPGCCIP